MATLAIDTEKAARSTVCCRLCDSPRFTTYLEGRGYRVVQCRDCGLRYINPQPTDSELRDFYADFDCHSTWRGDGEERFDRAMRDIVLRFRPNGSVLDIGSSRGNFLVAMRNAGFSVYGVEPSLKNSQFARSMHGVETCTGTVEEFLATPSRTSFDVVTMLNVFEHVKEPRQVLNRLRSLLSDEGIIVLVVPDARLHAFVGRVRKFIGSSDPFLMKNKKRPLVGFDPPAHICSFEPKLITRMVEDCGFKKLLVRNAPIIITKDTWKNLLKPVLYASCQILYYLSLRRVLVGYSTVVIARKSS
jgi:SAM-dependent methyltransferase